MVYHDRWVFQRGLLWSVELNKLQTNPVTAHLPVEFSQIEKDSFDRLMTTVTQMDPITPQAVAKRFEIGRECFIAQVNGSIAAYGWVTRDLEYVGEFERELQVQEGEAYIWDCATLPDYRRQRLFSSLLAFITERLRREGIKQIWIIGLNAALEINSGVAEVGFQPVMRLTYLRLINRRMLMLTPLGGISTQQLASARRLLKMRGEQFYGRMLVGNSVRPRPPDTHVTSYSAS